MAITCAIDTRKDGNWFVFGARDGEERSRFEAGDA